VVRWGFLGVLGVDGGHLLGGSYFLRSDHPSRALCGMFDSHVSPERSNENRSCILHWSRISTSHLSQPLVLIYHLHSLRIRCMGINGMV